MVGLLDLQVNILLGFFYVEVSFRIMVFKKYCSIKMYIHNNFKVVNSSFS